MSVWLPKDCSNPIGLTRSPAAQIAIKTKIPLSLHQPLYAIVASAGCIRVATYVFVGAEARGEYVLSQTPSLCPLPPHPTHYLHAARTCCGGTRLAAGLGAHSLARSLAH
jgi:hypothetical protein